MEESIQDFLLREAGSLDDPRYSTQREQDYLLGRVSLARHLLQQFFTEEVDPAQLPLEFPPNCS